MSGGGAPRGEARIDAVVPGALEDLGARAAAPRSRNEYEQLAPEAQIAYQRAQVARAAEISRDEDRARAYLDRAAVPRRLRQLSIDERLIPRDARAWCGTWPDGGSLLLAGPSGSGKTTTAVWCLRQVYRGGQALFDEYSGRARWHFADAAFWRAADLYAAVFDKDRATLAHARAVEVLVIDDWGAAYEHDWPLAELDLLVDVRWGEFLPTIVTTNVHPDQFQRLYPRAWTRLTDASGPGIVKIDRPNLRDRGRAG